MGKIESPVAIAPHSALRVAVILLIAGAPASPAAAQDAAATAFVGVTVLPMTGEAAAPQPDRTVIVRGGRIAAFGPAGEVEVPADARRIDGEDRWLLPGLIDSHVHLFSSSDLDLYLANGVTTIVNLGGYGAADSVLSIRQAVRDGRLAGPTIYTSGNWLDGDPPARDINTVVRTAAEGGAAVERQHAAGYDLVKVYEQLSPAAYGAIVETARSLNMPVTGHVPAAVGAAAVLASGQHKVEHGGALLFMRSIGADASAAAMDSLARAIAVADVAVTPTLWMARLAFEQRQGPGEIAEIAARPEMRYLPPPAPHRLA